jgi:hypothetical protein
MLEEWKKIENYDNYEVSCFGNVRNAKTGRILKPVDESYLAVRLSHSKNKIIKSCKVHRLVAEMFIENPENKPQVNHKDKNKHNNHVDNLEWVTNQENSIHRSDGVIQTTNQNLPIYCIDKDTGIKIKKYNSISEASEWLFNEGLSDNLDSIKASISCCIRGVYKHSFGYKWELQEQLELEDEEWREIKIEGKNTEGYFISSLGRFKNKKGVIMNEYKPHHTGNIYVRVNIDKYALHRLVAIAFIPNPENKPNVNHKDGNKLNNCVTNLVWSTPTEINLNNHNMKLITTYKRPIIQYDLEMRELNRFDSIVEASKQLNISESGIKAVLYKKQKTTNGFIFKYLEENEEK